MYKWNSRFCLIHSNGVLRSCRIVIGMRCCVTSDLCRGHQGTINRVLLDELFLRCFWPKHKNWRLGLHCWNHKGRSAGGLFHKKNKCWWLELAIFVMWRLFLQAEMIAALRGVQQYYAGLKRSGEGGAGWEVRQMTEDDLHHKLNNQDGRRLPT